MEEALSHAGSGVQNITLKKACQACLTDVWLNVMQSPSKALDFQGGQVHTGFIYVIQCWSQDGALQVPRLSKGRSNQAAWMSMAIMLSWVVHRWVAGKPRSTLACSRE